MQVYRQKKWNYIFWTMACSIFMLISLSAAITPASKHDLTISTKHDLEKYFEEMPWLGLVAEEVTYGPISVSQIHIHEGGKVAVAAPGENFNGSLQYRIKTEDLSALHGYHLIIGINGKGAQECVAHNVGIWDSKGKAKFKLTAPTEPGIYEVRFLFVDDITCSAAQKEWNSGKITPNANATVGIIIVE